MAASSSSSSSVTIDGFTYDVFLSFRGIDTRHVFTGNLWKALEDRGIRTFFDKEDIPPGKEITPSLLHSIKQSRMAIVVLSPNYASSPFCLYELSHIIDCIRGKGRLVWPIFYDVNPTHVRWLEGTYGEAMATHEASSWYTSDTLQKWKDALLQVANLKGTYYEWQNGGGYQYEFIEKIVKQVSRQIKPFTLYVADYLVGLEPKKEDIISLLDVGSDDGVHMAGIHGIGGIGKTTLALAVYNSIADQFEGSCYLAKVRENSEKPNGLAHLQKILLSKTVGEKEIEITSVNEGIAVIQQRLRQKKVLLILDDVDKLEQLQAIVGEPEWFGCGSRVIITTRDKGLLTCHGVKSTYRVEELSEADAHDLLRWKAFKSSNVSSSYADVLNRAVTYASGLPLALEVIGSHLFKKGIEDWRSALERYERIPNKKIQEILRLSFDTLDEEEKSVFLDIACCFKGRELAEVEKLLQAHHGENKKHHIGVLVEKSLIKIGEFGDVILHDLIEDMGKEIVRQESPEEPGKRSRLWYHEDIVQVLEKNTGTNKVEIIYFDSSIYVKWDEEAFKKMENLKTLVIKELVIRGGFFARSPKYLPNSLRILEWKPHPEQCAILKLTYWQFTSFMPGDLFKKTFENMIILNLDHCKILTKIPDVSSLPKLEELSFQDCMDLIRVDDSVGMLDKLKILRANDCIMLRSFPPIKSASLEELHLSHCISLESFPPVVDGLLGKLKILRVDYCSNLWSFPPLKLVSLEELDVSHCNSLESFPPVVDGLLGKLKILRADCCDKLRSFPPLKLASLEELSVSHCNSLECFPPVVEGLLDKLQILCANNCQKLRSFPPLKLTSLEELHLSHCFSLESFPPVVDGLLNKLKILNVECCTSLRSIPPLKLASLERLHLSFCYSLDSFPPMVGGSLGELKILSADNCWKLRCPPLNLPSLEQLDLSYCFNLESFPLMHGSVGKLEILRANSCTSLTRFPPFNLPSLKQLDLSNCCSLEGFPEILGVMDKITELWLEETPIKELPLSFQKLTRLQTLHLSDCGIVQLPNTIVMMTKLIKLTIDYGGWQFPKEEEGVENEIPMQSSQVEFINLRNCNLSDESLAIGLKWFANVKELDLSGSGFTTLPKFILKCRFLWKLVMKDCEGLEEIKGIPPSLKTLSAMNCESLTSSSKRKLLNQELHEAGNTWFCFPGEEVPEWFDHQCMERLSISFWFRNKFPDIVLSVVSPFTWYNSSSPVNVSINGNIFSLRDAEIEYVKLKMDHLHIFHMQIEKFNDNLDKALLENQWNHAEIDFGFPFRSSGIHVLKEKSSMKDIRFTNPENDVDIGFTL